MSPILPLVPRFTSKKWCKGGNVSSVPADSGHVGAAGVSVPGAVGVSGQTALGTGLTVELTLIQSQLRDAFSGADVQPLLQEPHTHKTDVNTVILQAQVRNNTKKIL